MCENIIFSKNNTLGHLESSLCNPATSFSSKTQKFPFRRLKLVGNSFFFQKHLVHLKLVLWTVERSFVNPPAKFQIEGRDNFSHSPGKSHRKGILFFKKLRNAPLGKPNSVLTFLRKLIRAQPEDGRDYFFRQAYLSSKKSSGHVECSFDLLAQKKFIQVRIVSSQRLKLINNN